MPAVRRAIEGSAVRDDGSSSARWWKRVGLVAMLVALAVVPVLALSSFASAGTGSGPRPAMTDVKRQCLADHGVSAPGRGGDGTGPRAEQRRARRAAAADCRLGAPHDRLRVRSLTDDQRQCLHDHGVEVAPGSGSSASAYGRATLRQAAEACGLPTRGPHGGGGDGQV